MIKPKYFTAPTSDLPVNLQNGAGPENIIKVVEWLEANKDGEFVAFIGPERHFVMRRNWFKRLFT